MNIKSVPYFVGAVRRLCSLVSVGVTLIYWRSFETNRLQTYRGQVSNTGWMRGTLVYNDTLSPVWSHYSS